MEVEQFYTDELKTALEPLQEGRFLTVYKYKGHIYSLAIVLPREDLEFNTLNKGYGLEGSRKNIEKTFSGLVTKLALSLAIEDGDKNPLDSFSKSLSPGSITTLL